MTRNADYAPTQEWSPYFYEHSKIYPAVDGLLYENVHDGAPALALYERGRDAIACAPDQVMRLDDPDFRTVLLDATLRLGFDPLEESVAEPVMERRAC